MIDCNKLQENSSLEDIYVVLYRNKPHRRSKLYTEWNYLESVAYEKLLIEDDRPNECDKIINEIIVFLKKKKVGGGRRIDDI